MYINNDALIKQHNQHKVYVLATLAQFRSAFLLLFTLCSLTLSLYPISTKLYPSYLHQTEMNVETRISAIVLFAEAKAGCATKANTINVDNAILLAICTNEMATVLRFKTKWRFIQCSNRTMHNTKGWTIFLAKFLAQGSYKSISTCSIVAMESEASKIHCIAKAVLHSTA